MYLSHDGSSLSRIFLDTCMARGWTVANSVCLVHVASGCYQGVQVLLEKHLHSVEGLAGSGGGARLGRIHGTSRAGGRATRGCQRSLRPGRQLWLDAQALITCTLCQLRVARTPSMSVRMC